MGGLEGVRVCINALTISHLLFVDDSLILMKENTHNASTFPNTNVDVRENVCRELDIVTEALSGTYLGLPTMVGIDESDCFHHLVDRVCQRLKGWKENSLSMLGEEILIKSVSQAIPSYAMSVFNLPKGICKSINDEIASFLWGLLSGICAFQMRKGVVGFMDLHSFNLAMLAKQCLPTNPEPCLFMCTYVEHKILSRWQHIESWTQEGILIHLAKHSRWDSNLSDGLYLAGWDWSTKQYLAGPLDSNQCLL